MINVTSCQTLSINMIGKCQMKILYQKLSLLLVAASIAGCNGYTNPNPRIQQIESSNSIYNWQRLWSFLTMGNYEVPGYDVVILTQKTARMMKHNSDLAIRQYGDFNRVAAITSLDDLSTGRFSRSFFNVNCYKYTLLTPGNHLEEIQPETAEAAIAYAVCHLNAYD